MKTSNKCIRDSCYYEKHTNIKNNGGTYCCRACRDSSTHGPACQKTLSSNYFINKLLSSELNNYKFIYCADYNMW